MNKPITMIIKETKERLANVCNESGLSYTILDLILQGIYSEVHSFAERQAIEEEIVYTKAIKDEIAENETKSSGDTNEAE